MLRNAYSIELRNLALTTLSPSLYYQHFDLIKIYRLTHSQGYVSEGLTKITKAI